MDTQAKNPPIISVRGSKIALGPFTFDYYKTFLNYQQDPDVAIYGSATFNVFTPEPTEEDFKRHGKDATIFTIFELDNLNMIGSCSLRGIDHRNGTATFGISIGRKEFWGHGYGTEATKLMLDYGFRFLNLYNIKLRTASFNERGQGAYRKAGFKEMGRRRSSILLAGKRYDDIYMDCLASEFVPPVPGWVLPFPQTETTS